MNTRRVHDLMRQKFPPIGHARREWAVVADSDQIEALLTEYVRSSEALVEVHRKLGALLPIGEAARFAATHIGEGEIRIADREFSGFVVIAQNGVATGWRMPDNPLLQRTLGAMRTVYSLRSDPGLASMQAASQGDGPHGLKQTHGLVGSADWWEQVDKGSLPTNTTSGTVIHFWPGHHGDWPEIELRESGGASSNWGCLIPALEATQHFMLDAQVEIDHVEQELKAPFNGSTATCVVTAIRVAQPGTAADGLAVR
ncbi:hypothetical protein [Roseateles sp. P5_D6]